MHDHCKHECILENGATHKLLRIYNALGIVVRISTSIYSHIPFKAPIILVTQILTQFMPESVTLSQSHRLQCFWRNNACTGENKNLQFGFKANELMLMGKAKDSEHRKVSDPGVHAVPLDATQDPRKRGYNQTLLSKPPCVALGGSVGLTGEGVVWLGRGSQWLYHHQIWTEYCYWGNFSS
jgi:hypothetical protein